MTRYRGRSASPRRRSRRSRSRSRRRSRSRGRQRSRSRSQSRGYRRSGHRSRSRSPRPRSPPRSSQRYGSPRRRTPPPKSPPRQPIRSPPHPSNRGPPQERRDYPPERARPRDEPHRASPPPYSQPRSRSPRHDEPPNRLSPSPRECDSFQQLRDRERQTEREWVPRRESPPPNYMEDVMRGLHQPKNVPSSPPQARSPPRKDARTSFRGRSASPPPRSYYRQQDEGYRERRSPVRSRMDPERLRERPSRRSLESHEESRHHDVVSSSTGAQQRQKVLLSYRFKDEHSDRPIKVEENITVEIHRKVQGEPVSYINRAYNPDEVVIIRRKDEGLKPIFDREELRNAHYPEEEEVETRVIKVVKKKETSHYRDDDRFRSATDHSRRYPGAGDQGMRIELRMGRPRSPEVRRDERGRSPDRGSERRVTSRDRLGERRPIDRRISFDRNRAENPTDLRNSLNRRRDDSNRDSRQVITDSREFRRPAPGGQSIRDRLGGRGGRMPRSDTAPLPDFSRRPDKFRYEEWMDKPEMVPKGISYFEHDNRGDQGSSDYWARRGRGRGRGGFRGRGQRGGGGYSYRERAGESSSGKWKHDKFRDEAETAQAQEDNKPSSTTENK
ncbi:serine/arginine repetitive matrix protein 1-like isoform X2 [Lineus longissimus]|uniref:serine/arginine repetitive matrix protein 1-like isoform X2 n=1 Tax=Lineus longissimus TaxID=88925 RepID=UPI00315D2644